MRTWSRFVAVISTFAFSMLSGCSQQPEFSSPDTLVSPTQLGGQVAIFQSSVRRGDWDSAYKLVSTRCQATWPRPEGLKAAVGDHSSIVSPLNMQTTKSDTDATVVFVWDGEQVRQRWRTDASGSWKYDSCD